LTGDVTGDLSGNTTGYHFGPVVGDVEGNVIGDLVGDVTGDLTGDLSGNTTGYHFGPVVGDIEGNVIGDIMGDVTGDLSGNTTGYHFGPVVGDVEGNVMGNLTGNTTGYHFGPVDLTGNNVGGATEIFKEKIDNELLFHTLDIGTGGLSISGPTANVITFDNTLIGNTLGDGSELYSDKTANILNFRSLVSGNNISIIQTATELEINAVAGSASSEYVIAISTDQLIVSGTGSTAASYTLWENAKFSGFTTNEIVFWCVPSTGSRDLLIALVNNGGATLGNLTVTGGSAPGFYSFSFTPPTIDTRLDLTVNRTSGGGTNPEIFGINMNLN